jgi:hypothetical protein
VVFSKILGGIFQVFHISGKIGFAKIPLAFPKTGEIKPKYPEALPGEGVSDIPQGRKILTAGKAMGKQDEIMWMPIGRGYQATCEQVPFPVFELYALGSHGKGFGTKVVKSCVSNQVLCPGQKGTR